LFLPHPVVCERDIRTEKVCCAGAKYTFWCDSGARIASGAVYLFMSPGAILACWRSWQAWRQTRQLKNIFLMLVTRGLQANRSKQAYASSKAPTI
jgi:hypothetical protein